MITKKQLVKFFFSIIIASLVFSPLKIEALSSIDQQIREIENKIKENKATVNQKKAESFDLQSQVSVMNSQISATQSNIDSLNKDISEKEGEIIRLQGEIEANEERVVKNKEDLKKFVQLLYEKGELTTVEVLVSAESITDFLDQEEYSKAIQDRINTTIIDIKDLKAKLEQQKKDQETQRTELQAKKDELEKQRKEQLYQKSLKDSLLAETKGEQAGYEAVLKKNSQVAQGLYEERRKQGQKNNEWYGGGGSGYPWKSRGFDPWGFYKLQCTSYASWKWNAVYGKSWHNTRPGSGSGYNWANLAYDQGYGVSYSPRVGAIMVWSKSQAGGSWGHVAIVEKVNGNGTVDVSEYNWVRPEAYGYRGNVSASGHVFIH